jgi:tetratricopeptide (TPR) repeat protein
MMRALILIFLLACAAGALPIPRENDLQTGAADRSRNVSEQIERLIREGDVAHYNLDYPTARERYQEVIRLAPDHPAGYYRLANDLWIETLNKSRRLSSSLYSSTSFYAEAIGPDKVDPKRDREFAELTEQALERARALAKRNPSEPEWLYYQGAVHGLRAAYTITVKRSFRQALGDGDDSVKFQKKVIELDKDFIDAYLNIGIYEYGVGSLANWKKFFAWIVGRKESKDDGIKHIEMVASRGRLARDDARVLLIAIYSREDQAERALEVVTDLVGKYPRNYLLGIERAVMLYRLGRGEDGERAFKDLIAKSEIAEEATDAVNYQWAEALQLVRNYSGAIERYRAVIEWPKSDPGLVTLTHLHLGQALDALGRRAEARAEYQIVLGRDNVYDSHKLARQFMKKPYVPTRRQNQSS